ncbi:hypothetical protein SMICM17S_01633 [Streptomyces microflavus]
MVSAVRSREPVAIHVSFVHSRMFTAMPIAILQGHPLIILKDDEPESVGTLFSQIPPGLIEAHPNTFLRWEVLANDPRGPLSNVKYFSSTFDEIHPRTVHKLLGASPGGFRCSPRRTARARSARSRRAPTPASAAPRRTAAVSARRSTA